MRAQRDGGALARRPLHVHRRLGRAPVGGGANERRQMDHHEARVGRDLRAQPRHGAVGQIAEAAHLASGHRARCGSRLPLASRSNIYKDSIYMCIHA